jgi:uncharacterized protein (TIGR03437 family)
LVAVAQTIPLAEGRPALPILFEKNHGQFPVAYDFVVRHAGGKVGLSGDGITFANMPGDEAPPLRIVFGNGGGQGLGTYTKLPVATKTNYIDAKSGGGTHPAENFGRVGYSRVVPGVDVEFYGNANRLEYDFIVAPGADLSDLHFRVEGAEAIAIDAEGNLRIERAGRELLQRPPAVYQQAAGERREIAARYVLSGRNRVDFAIAAFDPELPLVVDPILDFSTYFGSDGELYFTDHAVDAQGNVYGIGLSWATVLPGESQPPLRLPNDNPSLVFITKIAADWDRVEFISYISWQTFVMQNHQLALAPDGSIYFGYGTTTQFRDIVVTRPVIGTGPTQPVTPATSRTLLGKLNPTGDSLLWTAMVSCTGNQAIADLATDSKSRAILAINSNCQDYPVTAGAFRSPITAFVEWTAAITAVAADGSGADYSLVLGGVMADRVTEIHVTSGDAVILGGFTFSPDFPVTPGAFQTVKPSTKGDLFFTRVSADGSQLLASTFYGGIGHDTEGVFAFDAEGGVLAGFHTDSADLPAVGGSVAPVANSAFHALVRMKPGFGAATWATYLPGIGSLSDVGLDSAGNAFYLGQVYSISAGIPLTDDRILEPMEWAPGYLGRINAAGSLLTFGTALPGKYNALQHLRFLGMPGPVTRVFGTAPRNLALPVSPHSKLSPGLEIPVANSHYFMRINIQDPTICTYALQNGEQTVGWRGGEVNVPVVTSPGCPWLSSLDPSSTGRVRVLQAGGIGPGAVRFYLSENPSAEGNVAFGFHVNRRWAHISQERAPCSERSLAPSSVFFAPEGGQRSVTLKLPSGCDWRAKSNGMWFSSNLNLDWLYRDGTREFTVSAGRNDFEARTSSLTIAGLTLPIQQAGGPCTAAVSAASLEVPAEGAATTIHIAPSAPACTWQAHATPRVQLDDSASGTGAGSFRAVLPANPANIPVTEALLVAGKTLLFTQAAGSCTVTLRALQTEFGAQVGLLEVHVSASGSACAWMPSASSDWITFDEGLAQIQGSGVFRAYLSENTSGVTRSATLRLLGESLVITQQPQRTVAVQIDTPLSSGIPFRANGVNYVTPHTLHVPPGTLLTLEAPVRDFISANQELVVLDGWGSGHGLSRLFTVPDSNTALQLFGTRYTGVRTEVHGNAAGDGSRVLIASTTRLQKTLGDWAYYAMHGSGFGSDGLVSFTAMPGPGSRFVRWVSDRTLNPKGEVVTHSASIPIALTAEFAPLTAPPVTDSKVAASPDRVVFTLAQGTTGMRSARVHVAKSGASEVRFDTPRIECSGGPELPFQVATTGLTTPFVLDVSLQAEQLGFLSTGEFNQCVLRLDRASPGQVPLQVLLSVRIQSAAYDEPRMEYPVDAASYGAGPLAPGSIASVFGAQMAPGTGQAETVPLPTEIHGTRLVLSRDGMARECPLFYVSAGQINFLIPEDFPPGEATLTLFGNGIRYNSAVMVLGGLRPALFSANATGEGPAAGHFVRVEGEEQYQGSLVTCAGSTCATAPIEAPTRPDGKVVLVVFGTGIRQIAAPLTAEVGGLPATIEYAGPQGQFLGLDQVNILVPGLLYGSGERELRLRGGGASSNAVRIRF